MKDLCNKCDKTVVCSCTECKFGDLFDEVDGDSNGTLDKAEMAKFIKQAFSLVLQEEKAE